jgi:hypothetical protein
MVIVSYKPTSIPTKGALRLLDVEAIPQVKAQEKSS